MRTITFLLGLLLSLGCLTSCQDNGSAASADTASEPLTDQPPADPYLITETGFFGISPGDAIADHSQHLVKGVLQNGEGEFEVYYIRDEKGQELGYVLPSPNDESKVGDMAITTPAAHTPEGIKVGATLGQLEKEVGTLPVYGSEIEGRTTAVQGRLQYLLDSYNNSYEVDRKMIGPETEIREIWVQRG